MRSNPCRIISLLGIAHPVEGKIISSTEGSLGDGRHPSRDEEMAICGLVMYFCKNLRKRPSFG